MAYCYTSIQTEPSQNILSVRNTVRSHSCCCGRVRLLFSEAHCPQVSTQAAAMLVDQAQFQHKHIHLPVVLATIQHTQLHDMHSSGRLENQCLQRCSTPADMLLMTDTVHRSNTPTQRHPATQSVLCTCAVQESNSQPAGSTVDTARVPLTLPPALDSNKHRRSVEP
jgi:hypothetical protein